MVVTGTVTMLIAIAFYGTAEVARNMENPFDYDTDGHDIEAAGFAHFKESRTFREVTFDLALPSAVSDILSSGKHSQKTLTPFGNRCAG